MDVIRAALNELGCEELPLGYDLSMESSFTDSPAISKVIRIISIISTELNITVDIIYILFSYTHTLNVFQL